MDFEDEEDVPALVNTTVSHNDTEASGSEVTKTEDFRVPLTIVTGILRKAEPFKSYLSSLQAILGLEKPH